MDSPAERPAADGSAPMPPRVASVLPPNPSEAEIENFVAALNGKPLPHPELLEHSSDEDGDFQATG
jgi:hypothetical protein